MRELGSSVDISRDTMFVRLIETCYTSQESLNSVISCITERAPNISTTLLASRITLKKLLTHSAEVKVLAKLKESRKTRITQRMQRQARLESIDLVSTMCIDPKELPRNTAIGLHAGDTQLCIGGGEGWMRGVRAVPRRANAQPECFVE